MTRDGDRQAARSLWGRLQRAPFPQLGKRVGDFGFYDSLLAGYLSQAACDGVWFPAERIPAPDQGTLECIADLRRKATLTDEERAFVEYFELQEQIRALLQARYESS